MFIVFPIVVDDVFVVVVDVVFVVVVVVVAVVRSIPPNTWWPPLMAEMRIRAKTRRNGE